MQGSDYVYGAMWDVEQFDRHVSQIFQRCKDANAMQKTEFLNEVKVDLGGQAQSAPKQEGP